MAGLVTDEEIDFFYCYVVGARALLTRMDSEGIQASSICYDSYVRAHAKSNDPAGVAAVFDRIRQAGTMQNRDVRYLKSATCENVLLKRLA